LLHRKTVRFLEPKKTRVGFALSGANNDACNFFSIRSVHLNRRQSRNQAKRSTNRSRKICLEDWATQERFTSSPAGAILNHQIGQKNKDVKATAANTIRVCA
jgi:hypothetical protein